MIMLRSELQKAPRFSPGDLVRHRRYNYRGVVVAYDPRCMASDAWYQANQTQPDRNQPWYHVLVHESDSVTYPAENSLAPDPSGEPVSHPLLEQFFSGFAKGRHQRNHLPWSQT